MSDVLLGQAYYLRFDPKLWAAMQPYPPLGTLYAASLLRQRGYQVALFDAMLAESESEWDRTLERAAPRFAVLFEDNFNYLSKMCLGRMRQAALTMIELARARGCTVLVCGADPSDHPEIYLQRGAQFVLFGEGELTLAELLDRLSGRSAQPLESIAGLHRLDPATGRLISTARRPDLRELDALPFPAWDLIDVERYRRIWLERHGHFSINMVTTRGCPYHCNWCAKPIWGQRYNSRSPENVIEELLWLKRTYRPDHIGFADDILGLKPGWLPRFAALVESLNAKLPFKCLSRADLLLREGEIAALRRAGCSEVWIGAESGSQKILDAMEKGIRVEQIRAAARRLHQAGIRVGFFLQFGYPGEGRTEIEQTFELVRDCAPDDIGMSVSYPLPGTPFHRAVREQLGAKQNWDDSDDLAMLYRGPFSTGFYRQLYRVLHGEFRARKSLREVGAALRRPAGLRPRHLRRLAAATYHAAALPLGRARLAQLARRPHDGMQPLGATLSTDEAAAPTAQA
ncbi:MAG TPA: radical SAM protein [Acidobacteriota bacterium]